MRSGLPGGVYGVYGEHFAIVFLTQRMRCGKKLEGGGGLILVMNKTKPLLYYLVGMTDNP